MFEQWKSVFGLIGVETEQSDDVDAWLGCLQTSERGAAGLTSRRHVLHFQARPAATMRVC